MKRGVFRINPLNEDYFYGLAIVTNKLMLYANINRIERLNLNNRFYERYQFLKQERSIKDLFANYDGKFLVLGNFNKDTCIHLSIDPTLGKIIEQKDLDDFNTLERASYNNLSLVIN